MFKGKANVVDHEEDDTVEFRQTAVYQAMPEKNNGLSDDVELILPHTLLLSAIVGTAIDKPKLLPVVGKWLVTSLHVHQKNACTHSYYYIEQFSL